MTSCEITRPHAEASRFGARIAAALARTIRRTQYARMVSVLARLSDTQLAAAGLSRAEIPRQARRLIYGQGRHG
jgi:uncharacterized protein YjiS (DUF1127 family)